MGQAIRYRCKACGYEETLGLGVGMAGLEYEVMACRECQRLVGVLVHDHIEDKPVKPRCPVDPNHHLAPWDAPGPCPRCGQTIRAGSFTGEMWD